MARVATDSWERWQERIAAHLRDHGLLPTGTTTGIEYPADIAADCWWAADRAPKELSDLCRLTSAMDAPAERGAVILFLAYLNDDTEYLRLPESDESARAAVHRLYSDAVSLLPPDSINTTWQIRWELLFAASTELWPRVTDLIQRWVALAPSEEHQALLALARINCLSVHPSRTSDWVPDWWSSYEGSEFSWAGEVFCAAFASRLDDRKRLDSTEWSLPDALSVEEFRRVLEAETAIVKLQDSTHPLTATARLVGTWSAAVAAVRHNSVARIQEAAERYAELARDPDLPKPLFEGTRAQTRRFPAWSAAVLFRLAGDLDSARDMATFWTEIDGDSAEAWKFRAEIERQIGLDSWPEAYEAYVRLSAEIDTSWEHSELLRLALESRDDTTADRALRALAFEHADRPAVEEMLAWDWPSYPLLDKAARERWWDGLVFVCDARVRQAFRRWPWRYAAGCFGEAVALELKARIFRPFAVVPAREGQRLSDHERRIRNAILGTKLTLGTMIEALDLTSKTGSEFGQMLGRFLGQSHRPLRAHLRSKQAIVRLRALTDSRNEAVHGDIAPDEAKQVYIEAKAFLDVLVKEDPRPKDG